MMSQSNTYVAPKEPVPEEADLRSQSQEDDPCHPNRVFTYT
jgi:hypothetical protein